MAGEVRDSCGKLGIRSLSRTLTYSRYGQDPRLTEEFVPDVWEGRES